MMFTRDEGERTRLTLGEAHRLLVVAVLAQAAVDIVAGLEDMEWLGSAVCRHWCEWVDLEPTAVRREVERQVGSEKRLAEDLTSAQIAWAVQAHEGGASWEQAAGRLGTSKYSLRKAAQAAGYRTDRVDRRVVAVAEV